VLIGSIFNGGEKFSPPNLCSLKEMEIIWKAWNGIFDLNNTISVHKVFESSFLLKKGKKVNVE
jgi:hypothetical protein